MFNAKNLDNASEKTPKSRKPFEDNLPVSVS